MAKYKKGDVIYDRRNPKERLEVVGFRDKETYLCKAVPSEFGFEHPFSINFIDKYFMKVDK